MQKLSPATSASTLVAMHKAYALLNAVSYAVGDLTLVEYCFLLRGSRSELGTSVKELTEEFSFFVGDPAFLTKNIVQKELATLVRNVADRRGLALRTNGKGILRLKLVDETMTLSLIDVNEVFTQESIEYLTEYCQHTMSPSAEKAYVDTLIPSEFVLLLCRYRAALMRSSACVGLSTLHAVILLSVDLSPKSATAAGLMHGLRIPEPVLLPQLDFLEDRRLLEEREDGAFELGEEGFLRIDSFMKKSNSVLQELLHHRSNEERNLFDELCEYCGYLFR